MSRYPAAQPTPPEPTAEGDPYFDKVNMKEERSTLPVGTLALSVNKRLRTRKAACRAGIWPPVFANILNLTRIRGFGVFSIPNGDEVLLVAGDTEIYAIRDGTYPTTLQAEGPLGDSVEFVQAGNKIFLFQGTKTVQLVWDGVSSDGFVRITKTHPEDTSTKLIPPAVTAEAAADRLLIVSGNNDVLATDIGDYTSVDTILEDFYVNRGTSETIVRVFAYAKAIAIVFKTQSTTLLLNYTGDGSLASIEVLNKNLGLAGMKAAVMLGGDVLFLSEPGGIYRIAQVLESRLQTVPLPVTDPIQPLIARINWKAAKGAVAVAMGEYVKFAVPIDGSEVNNCVIVYNGATDIVEGYDTYPAGFQIDDFAVTLYDGERRLFALDKNTARIYLMDEGKSDFVYDSFSGQTLEHEIDDLMETRGYSTLGWNAGQRRDFKKVEINVDTWAPSIVVTEMTEAGGDERLLNVTPITKSRTAYKNFLKKDWDTTNKNLDWDTPGREDYSIAVDDVGFDPTKFGIDFDRKQTSPLRFSTKCRGRYVSYRVANSQGQCDVAAVLVESTGTQWEPRRAG